ncbi:MAG TPA: DUF4276 family protein [Planctomycetota bacterium]|nr:DUF4276 family protein [Planctomycetota bacterium]
MKLLIFSEGPSDVGSPTASWDVGAHGAIRALTASVLARRFGRAINEWEIEVEHLPRLQRTNGFPSKVVAAIRLARSRQCTSAAIVIDNDRTGDRRLRLLSEGRDDALADGDPSMAALANHTALGVAVECMEAWLLADEGALSRAAEAEIARQPDPETFQGRPGEADHPKARLASVLALHEGDKHPAELREAAARNANPENVAARCPSFKKYADELRQRVT